MFRKIMLVFMLVIKIDPDGELLKGINIGKGCIRFNKSLSLSGTRIEEFIERAVHLWKLGVDLEC